MQVSHNKPDCKETFERIGYIRMRLPSGSRKAIPIMKICMNCNSIVLDKTEYYDIVIARENLKVS